MCEVRPGTGFDPGGPEARLPYPLFWSDTLHIIVTAALPYSAMDLKKLLQAALWNPL